MKKRLKSTQRPETSSFLTDDNKATQISEFQTAANYADYLARLAQRQGDQASAASFRQRETRLRAELAIFWAQLFDDWVTEAGALTVEAQKRNATLKAEIKKIEQAVHTAQDVIRMLGLLDQIIDLAKRMVP